MSPTRTEAVFVSYNVHSCRGTDGRVDADRVGAVIRDLNADVVGLQEVDCRFRDAEGKDQLTRLAEVTGSKAIPGPTIRAQGGFYGNGILTRQPAIDVIQTSLSYRRREPRGMMDVILDVGGARVRVIVTHFGLLARERRHQVDVVLNILQSEQDVTTPPRTFDALVLAGDFNEWRPNSVTLARLHEALGRAPAVRTFPSRLPLLALDRIWVRPREALVDSMAVKTKTARVASDHLPVRAVLDLARLNGSIA
jgi:endonuclease/exonuclease/phosphatase family metal-dependent hydrolase